MKTPVIYRADYVDHSGTNSRVYVRVHTTLAEDGSRREVYYAYHPARLGCGKNADTPADAVRCLVADHGWFTSCNAMPPTLTDLKADISRAYQDALQKAKRITGKGFHRSRGRYVVITSRNDALVGFGEWEWKGTAKQLAEVIQYALDNNVTGIYIDGGVDFAEVAQGFGEVEWSLALYHSNVETFRGVSK